MTALEGELVSKAGLSAQEAKEISDQLREHYGLDKTIWVQFAAPSAATQNSEWGLTE